MPWEFNDRAPVFIQIADKIRIDIVAGKYPSDGQIPPVRQLAFEISVNPNTVQRALTQLEEEGLLYAKGTAGRYVTSDNTVLDAAKKRIKQQALSRALEELRELGITYDELIDYIRQQPDNKEENRHER